MDDSTTIVSSGPLADESKDSEHVEHSLEGPGVVSIDDNIKSRVVVNCCLNMNEPSNQMVDGSMFKFDEIALYSGSSASKYSGVQLVNVGSVDYFYNDTGLKPDFEYTFDIMVGKELRNIIIKTPTIGTGFNDNISYGDLLLLLNNSFKDITVEIINDSSL